MKPRTKRQKDVAMRSNRLPKITDAQSLWAQKHCFASVAIRSSKKVNYCCSSCGEQWESAPSELVDYVTGVVCPYCRDALSVINSRKKKFDSSNYMIIVTTSGEYQVIRYVLAEKSHIVGKTPTFNVIEMAQSWISPNGGLEIISRRRSGSYWGDTLSKDTPMEIRLGLPLFIYGEVYPIRKYTPEIKRNGFKGNFHECRPVDLFRGLLIDPKAETLIKAERFALLRHRIVRPDSVSRNWREIKICIRNRYKIADANIWIDYVEMLRMKNIDTLNPKHICPNDLREEHDKLVRARIRENQRAAQEAERRRRHEGVIEKAKNYEVFASTISQFANLNITDGEILIKPLQIIEEFKEEGEAMHHCVYQSRYYGRPNTLVLSAKLGTKRLETIELNLKTYEVVQCRGKHNQLTDYHQRIIDLVNDKMPIIRRMAQ